MIRSTLPSEILARYNTDKGSGPPEGHSYGRAFYDHYLPRYRWCSGILEIGIWYGESLRAWSEYFSDAAIIGLDIEKSYLINDERIKSFQIDCGNEKDLDMFGREYNDYFSLAIDDGSHLIDHQLVFVRTMKKYLKRGGLLVVEDVATVSNANALQELGCKIEEYAVHVRPDDRIAYWINI